MKRKVGIIGFGNMGSAIAERIKSKCKLYVFDKDRNKTGDLLKIDAADNIVNLVTEVEAIILAVKPQDFDTVLEEIKGFVKDKLIISVAAGITTLYIEKRLGCVRVIRVMPNLPARIGKGMICLSKGSIADKADLYFAEKLFSYLGKTLILNEDMMDAATAISGSGPGYIYDWSEGKNIKEIRRYIKYTFIPSFISVAENIGFTPKQAKILTTATGKGSILFLERTHIPPSELKRQVASKGGTTEAGLEVLHRGGSLEEAVKAALSRAKELSK